VRPDADGICSRGFVAVLQKHRWPLANTGLCISDSFRKTRPCDGVAVAIDVPETLP